MHINSINAVSERFNTGASKKSSKKLSSEIINSTIAEDYKNTNKNAGRSIYKDISFGGFFSDLFMCTDEIPDLDEDMPGLSYHERISAGLNNKFGIYIPAENLTGIMTPEQLRQALPSFRTQNFIYSPVNQQKGIYSADLDYKTAFSYDGNEDIPGVLEKAVRCANYYNKKTGRKFIFSITDNDTLDGMQHAIAYIGSNAPRFRNLLFAPGIRLSFAHRAPNSNAEYQNSKMLIYCFNPCSDNVLNFVNDTLARREEMVNEFLMTAALAYKEYRYSADDFLELNNVVFAKDLGNVSLYARLREYLLSRGGINIQSLKLTPQEIYELSEDIFHGMDTVLKGSDETMISKLFSTIIKDKQELNLVVRRLFEKYASRYSSRTRTIESGAENIYGRMIKCFAAEPDKPVMSIAEPYYYTYHLETPGEKKYTNVAAFLEYLRRSSQGMMIGFESAAPAYELDRDLPPEIITEFNDAVRQNTSLYETGGSLSVKYKNPAGVY